MKPWAIVLAAGSGERFGRAKQFRELAGRRLVDRVVDAVTAVCEAVVVVLPAGAAWDGPPVRATPAGGGVRAESVRAGLAAVPSHVPAVVVHDAAHPLVSTALLTRVIAAVEAGADAAVPVLPVTETTRRLAGGAFTETIARDGLVLVQSPQAFRTAALRRAHERRPALGDDSVLVEASGGRVVAVPGDPFNVHVTSPTELLLAEALVTARRPA